MVETWQARHLGQRGPGADGRSPRPRGAGAGGSLCAAPAASRREIPFEEAVDIIAQAFARALTPRWGLCPHDG